MAIQDHSHITKLTPNRTLSLGRSLVQDDANFIVTAVKRQGKSFVPSGGAAPVKGTDFSVDFAAGTVQALTVLPGHYEFAFKYDDNQTAIDAALAAVAAIDSALNTQLAADLEWADAGGGLQTATHSTISALSTDLKRLGLMVAKMAPVVKRHVDEGA